jgi:hypothetical protein
LKEEVAKMPKDVTRAYFQTLIGHSAKKKKVGETTKSQCYNSSSISKRIQRGWNSSFQHGCKSGYIKALWPSNLDIVITLHVVVTWFESWQGYESDTFFVVFLSLSKCWYTIFKQASKSLSNFSHNKLTKSTGNT